MALTYIGSALSLSRGVASAETGISVSSFAVRYYPHVRAELENNLGEIAGLAVSTLASREITVEGEVTGATGRMADTFIAAITTIANGVTDFGGATGGIYMTAATVTSARADWKKVNLTYKSDPILA